METAVAQLAPLLAGLGVVSLLMVRYGVDYGLLELRRPERTCPSCGRRIEDRVCGRCAA
jgi:hypothetical protein